MKTTHELGSSFLEGVIALALTSALCLSLTRLQLHLLHHANRMYQKEIGMRTQSSLAERLRSCSNSMHCQQLEIQNWTQELPFGTSELIPSRSFPKTMVSQIHWHEEKYHSSLQFSYV